MSLLGLRVSGNTPEEINNQLVRIDQRIQNLTKTGLLPFSSVALSEQLFLTGAQHASFISQIAGSWTKGRFFCYGTAASSGAETYVTFNADLTGDTWNRDNTGFQAWALRLGSATSTFEILYAAPGANPISWTSLLFLNNGGNLANSTWAGTKIGLAYGGTNADLSATGGAHQFLRQNSVGAAVGVVQPAASDLSNGTTGSGSVVLAAAPTVTTLNVSDKNLQLNGAQWQSFVLRIVNSGGTLQHAITSDIQSGGASNFAGKISGESAALANTPSVNNVTNFTSGGGIDAGTTSIFVFNTAAQINGDMNCTTGIEFNSAGTDLSVGILGDNINVNGTTRNWLGLRLFNATTGAAFAITTANIAAGKEIDIRVSGYVY